MRMLTKIALAGAASLALAGPANAAVITFSGLTTDNAAFTTLTEAGFIVSQFSGGVPLQSTTVGNPAGSVLFNTFGGFLEITRSGGGTFTASSLDLLSGSYLAIGYLAGSQVGFTFGTGTGSFATYAAPTGTFDRLTINVSGPATGLGAAYLDNINVTNSGTAPAVPEPATWAMMLAGFGLVGSAMRRKQTVRVKFA